jgi:hypothetical protein
LEENNGRREGEGEDSIDHLNSVKYPQKFKFCKIEKYLNDSRYYKVLKILI